MFVGCQNQSDFCYSITSKITLTMKYSHLAVALLAIAICFVAVEAKPKGQKVGINHFDNLAERAQDHQQGVLRY